MKRQLLVLALPAFVTACGGQVEMPTAGTVYVPPGVVPRQQINAVTPVNTAGFPGSESTAVPTVTVTNSSGNPLADVAVACDIVEGNGTVAITRAVTGTNGQASCGKWQLGATAGLNILRVSVANATLQRSGDVANYVYFLAAGTRFNVAQVFDLVTIGGRALPAHQTNGATSWDVLAGTYVLYDDGVYSVQHVARLASGSTDASPEYGAVHSTTSGFEFSAISYGDRGLVATGELSGNSLTVTYTNLDCAGCWDYALAPSTNSASLFRYYEAELYRRSR